MLSDVAESCVLRPGHEDWASDVDFWGVCTHDNTHNVSAETEDSSMPNAVFVDINGSETDFIHALGALKVN